MIRFLNKRVSKLSPALLGFFYSQYWYNMSDFHFFELTATNIDIHNTSDPNVKLLMIYYVGGCANSSELITFLYNKKSKCYKRDVIESNNFGKIETESENLWVHYPFKEAYSWNPKTSILTINDINNNEI